MSEMIERVARALAIVTNGDEALDDAPYFTQAARAAIEAMLIDEAVEGVPGGIAFEDAFFGSGETAFHAMKNAWNATIRAALAEAK